MLKHIKTNHLVISNFELSSRNPEEMVNVIGGMSSNDESEDYQNNSKVSENESKNDSTSNVDEQINNSTRNDEDKNSGIKNLETMKEDYQNDSKVSEIVLKNDSTTSNADDENINDSTTDDEVFYDPEPFMGCPCGKKYFSDIPYKKHMATFHPLTNSPKKDTSYTEEQIKTLNRKKDFNSKSAEHVTAFPKEYTTHQFRLSNQRYEPKVLRVPQASSMLPILHRSLHTTKRC